MLKKIHSGSGSISYFSPMKNTILALVLPLLLISGGGKENYLVVGT